MEAEITSVSKTHGTQDKLGSVLQKGTEATRQGTTEPSFLTTPPMEDINPAKDRNQQTSPMVETP